MRRDPYVVYLLVVLALVGGLAWIQTRSTDDPTIATVDEAIPTSVNPVEAPPATEPAAPGREAIAMPPMSQFESIELQAEQAVNIGRLTGIVWNDDEGAYFAISQDGRVYRVDRELTEFEVALDLTAETTELEGGSERGLLGIAFDPRDGRMFIYFTDRGDDTHVVSMMMTEGLPDVATRREVLFVEQPGLGHKAGDLQFDAEGNLFVAVGDGGGSQGYDAQDGSSLLGKILRIVPHLDAEGYDIPADNPFVERTDIRDEVWAMGLRNPWQITLDEATGDMYIGDVGESDAEELDVIPAGTSGQNFGWPWFEGARDRQLGDRPDDVEFTRPVHWYPHTLGPAVIGGRTYYGTELADLRGAYLFADMTGPVFALGQDGVARLDITVPGIVTTFAETPDGELLVTTLENGVMRLVPG
ncbi:MAG: hypothetical protein HKN44_04915 [Ilumatobacter sp.]|nr:hypothetical protein [Ilumatobacter sp.]